MAIGILGISYGSRFACMADSLSRSSHKVKLFIADKQRNPFNVKKAEKTGGKHVVIPDLNVEDITKFAKRHEKEIEFGVLGPEAPGMKGVRDRIEKETKIKMICPTAEYFIERSKVEQRKLMENIVPSANPRFKVFNPKDHGSKSEVKKDVYKWLDEVGDEVAVKPDAPATGKGVGVWGDHFTSRKSMFENFFLPNFERGPVIVEEKVEGEEFSLQFVSDGEHLVPTPAVRDYKRAFDWDLGPNCYSEDTEILTGDGWKTFDKLTNKDKVATFDPNTRQMHFEKPKKVYWRQYKGKMVAFKHRFIDLLVTPNHRMLVMQRRGNKRVEVVEAKDYRGERYIFQAVKWLGSDLDCFILPKYDYKFNRKLAEKKIPFRDWVRFLGIYLSEGYAVKNRIYISQSKKSKYFGKFVEILKRLPFKFSYEESKNSFRINSTQLSEYLMQFGNSRQKHVPVYVKNATPNTIKEFLESFCLGDGDIHYGKMRFHTSSKRLVDDIQEMLLKIGRRGIITVDKRHAMINPLNKKQYQAHPVYSIEENRRETTSIRKNNVRHVDYTGYIGCVTVSTGFVVIRRNNRVAISGNTGGMGSYKDRGDLLPFMRERDWREALEIGEKIHQKLKGTQRNPEVRGNLYMAYIITKDGVKVLEINSRWGDPEVMNILPVLKEDFVEVCFKILDGNLRKLNFEDKATVVTYAVPLGYGGYASYSGSKKVDLSQSEKLKEKYGDSLRIYPGAMELKGDETYALKSRAVAIVGISKTLEGAREISIDGIRKIDGPLRHREDIALPEHIKRSKKHVEEL